MQTAASRTDYLFDDPAFCSRPLSRSVWIYIYIFIGKKNVCFPSSVLGTDLRPYFALVCFIRGVLSMLPVRLLNRLCSCPLSKWIFPINLSGLLWYGPQFVDPVDDEIGLDIPSPLHVVHRERTNLRPDFAGGFLSVDGGGTRFGNNLPLFARAHRTYFLSHFVLCLLTATVRFDDTLPQFACV